MSERRWESWAKAFDAARKLGARLTLETDGAAWEMALADWWHSSAPTYAERQEAYRAGRLEVWHPSGACVVLVRAGGPAALVSQQEEMRQATDLANGKGDRFA